MKWVWSEQKNIRYAYIPLKISKTNQFKKTVVVTEVVSLQVHPETSIIDVKHCVGRLTDLDNFFNSRLFLNTKHINEYHFKQWVKHDLPLVWFHYGRNSPLSRWWCKIHWLACSWSLVGQTSSPTRHRKIQAGTPSLLWPLPMCSIVILTRPRDPGQRVRNAIVRHSAALVRALALPCACELLFLCIFFGKSSNVQYLGWYPATSRWSSVAQFQTTL